MLQFDGSHLGTYSFQDVILSIKMVKNSKFLAHTILLTNSGIEEVLMYKFDKHSDYSIAVDEIKPLFGLRKTGTHIIKLSHSPRKINLSKTWDSTVDNYSYNVEFVPQQQTYLLYKFGIQTKSILEPEFDGEIQKYILFQEAVKNTKISLDNFFLSKEGYIQSHELSFTEFGKELRIHYSLLDVYTFPDKSNALRVLKKHLNHKLLYDLHKQLPDKQIHLASIIFEVLKL